MSDILGYLAVEHDWRLIAVACAVNLLASLCAVGLFQRARSSQERARATWILVASMAAGIGIWATHLIATLAHDPDIAIANAAITVLGMSLVASLMALRLRDQSAQTTVALNNMPHGLCMFGSKKRLVTWNSGYSEMYRLPPELSKVGTPHEAIIAHRVSSGLLAVENQDAGVEPTLAALGKMSTTTKSSRIDKLADGRLICVTRQPMAEGGWVATHEDITEQHRLEMQRNHMAAQETRRASIDGAIASFRERIEALLGTVSNNTNAMKSTATALFGSSGKTTQRAQEALRGSNEASTNVATVAASAEELSSSIAEINKQLSQTTQIVGNAVTEVEAT